MLFWKIKNSTSNASRTSRTLVACPTLASKVSVKLLHVLKTLYNNQCLRNLFITQTLTTRFNTHVNVFAIAHTSTLGTFYYKAIVLCHPQHKIMAFLNSNTFSNMIILLANLVFTWVLSFWGRNPFLSHAFSHSCLPFIHACDFFCKLPWATFTLTYFKPIVISHH